MTLPIYGQTVNNIPAAKKLIKKATENQLLAAAILWHKSLVDQVLVGQRSGRIYPVPKAINKKYQASAPGEPPARRTGAMAGDYKPRVRETAEGTIGEVGSTFEYAQWMETGTSKIAKRPHLKPAYMLNQTAILAALVKDWKLE